jgi:hypothetical protein
MNSLCSFVDLHGSCGCLCTKVRSERIGESWIESSGRFRADFDFGIGGLSPVGPYGFELCVGGVCFLLIVLIFFQLASSFISLLG